MIIRIFRGVMLLAILSTTGATAQTNEAAPEQPPEGRLLKHSFRDYTLLFLAPSEEPWQASWNDPGQMAIIQNPTNGVVITCQYLKFPLDPALRQAAGDRDAFLDIALRKYCAAVFALGADADVAAQPVKTESRSLGGHYFRYAPVWGRDRNGVSRRGCFYIMLRGPAEKPSYDGETLILTTGYPDLIAPDEERRALKTFDVLLQNASFY